MDGHSRINQGYIAAAEARCTANQPPAAQAVCPLHVDCRGISAALAAGDASAAKELYCKVVPLPHTLSAFCEEPCKAGCLRKDFGGAIEMRALEASAMAEGTLKKKRLMLPRRTERAVVIGGGVCGVTAALELGKKGIAVTILEKSDRLGGALCARAELAPWEADCARLADYPVTVQYGVVGDPAALAEYDAIFAACGAEASFTAQGDTYWVEGKLFAGGACAFGPERSLVACMMDGKRAALSIERFLKGVNLLYGREAEGVFTTDLPVDTRNVQSEPCAGAIQKDASWAQGEAGRCLRCACEQCVAPCAFMRHYKTYPRKLLREIATTVSMSMGNRTANTAINSCSLCGQCGAICPGGLDMGTVIADARAVMVESGHMPAWPFDFALDDLAHSNAEGFLARGAAGEGPCDALFFPGCQLGGSAPEAVLRAFRDLRAREPRTGILLGCCGVGARWAGREALFAKTQAMLKESWEKLGRPRMIFACPTCMQTMDWATGSTGIWDVLQTGLPAGYTGGKTVCVHDACGARGLSAVRESVRAVLRLMGCTVEEQPYNEEKTGCCGFGGYTEYANPAVADEAARLAAPGDALYLTYCVNCRDRFQKNGARAVHLLELAYGLQPWEPPTYSRRRDNREALKARILREVYGVEETVCEQVPLYYGEEVAKDLAQRLILEQHIRAVITDAERSGNKLRHAPSGLFIAHKRIGSVTFWAYYRPERDGFWVERAYSYRMEAHL